MSVKKNKINKKDKDFGSVKKKNKTKNVLVISDETFCTLVDVSPSGIYMTDKNGDCIYANKSWLEMAGLTMDEAKGKGWIKGIHPDDRKKINDAWYKMVKSKGKWGIEYRFKDDGSIVWVYGMATTMKDKHGKIIGFMGTNTDITEKKKAEEKLKQKTKDLQRLNTSMMGREKKMIELKHTIEELKRQIHEN